MSGGGERWTWSGDHTAEGVIGRSNWIVSVPKILQGKKYVGLLGEVLPIVVPELYPLLKRAIVYVDFPAKLMVEGEGGETYHLHGSFEYEKRKRQALLYLGIHISRAALEEQDEAFWSASALYTTLHELYEANYWLLSQRLADPPVPARLGPNYSQADHETYANQNAVRMMQMVWNTRKDWSAETGYGKMSLPASCCDVID